MSINRGKQFEQKFRQDWNKTVLSGFIYRLPDQLSGQKFTSSNLCDFLCYKYPNLFCIECKSIAGNTFPISNLTQLDKMKSYLGIEGIRCGVLIWFIDHDKEVYVPIKTFLKLKEEDKKSFNIKTTSEENYIVIPTIKKKVFLDADYSVLLNLEEGW